MNNHVMLNKKLGGLVVLLRQTVIAAITDPECTGTRILLDGGHEVSVTEKVDEVLIKLGEVL